MAIPNYSDAACKGCRRRWRPPPYHIVGDGIVCESCLEGLIRVMLAVVYHVQESETDGQLSKAGRRHGHTC